MKKFFSFAHRHPIAMILIVLIVLGGALRCMKIFFVLEFDELVTMRLAVVPWRDLWYYLGYENTPPFFFLLAWMWAHVFPLSIPIVRTLPILIGIAGIPLFYWAFWPSIGKKTALLGAGFFATSPLMAAAGSYLRSYGLVVVIGLAYLGCFDRWLRQDNRRYFIAGTACAVVGALSHIEFMLVVAAAVLGALSDRTGRLRWRYVAIHALTVACVFSTWLIYVVTRHDPFGYNNTWYGGLSVSSSSAFFTWISPLLDNFRDQSILSGILAVVALVLIMLWLGGNRSRWTELVQRDCRFMFGASIFLFLVLIFVPIATGVVWKKYFLVCMVPFFAYLARGAMLLRPRVLVVASLALYGSLVSIQYAQLHVQGDANMKFAKYFSENGSPGDRIVVHPFGYSWVLASTIPSWMEVEGFVPYRNRSGDSFTDALRFNYRNLLNDQTVGDFEGVAAGARRLWVVLEPNDRNDFYHNTLLVQWMRKQGWLLESKLMFHGDPIVYLVTIPNDVSSRTALPSWLDELRLPVDSVSRGAGANDH